MEIFLKRIREERNVTQEELAEHLGVRQVHVSQMERGIRPLSFAFACEIADYLNVSLDELAGRKRPDKPEN